MDPTRQNLLDLLELQKIDSTIDRFEARRRHLPEQAELEALEERLTSLEKSIGEQRAILDEIVLRQKKLDGDIEMITQKIEAEEAKLYSGSITSPKELSDLQKEGESLKRRRSSLEDQDLEVMEEREKAEHELDPLLGEAEEVRRWIAETTTKRDRAAQDIDASLSTAKADRGEWVPKVPGELLELYDDLRSTKAGVGAAAMIDGACQGCHMRLPAQEFERVRKAEGLVFCDECRRILVVV